MSARMRLAGVAKEGYQGMFALGDYLRSSGLPERVKHLVDIRASQINGCSFCLHMHNEEAQQAGESAERLLSVAAWRESPLFTDEERAALALTEAATRLSDSAQGVPDEVWDAAAEHFDEKSLAGLVMAIATINAWNRINVTIQQPAAVSSRVSV